MADYKYINELGGLMTDSPEDKIPDRNASDIANIDLSIKGLVQTAKGKRLFGNQLTEIGSLTSGYFHKKAFGTVSRVLLRVRDNGTNSILEWFNVSNVSNSADGEWETIFASLTTGAVMGFTPFNNTNVNALVFCNAVDDYYVWNSATTLVSSVTANTIVTTGPVSLANEGFTATGSIIIDGAEYAYTGLSGSTFTGVTPDPTTQDPSANTGIVQKPTAYASNPKGNIFITASARVWMAGVSQRGSTLYYSKVGDPNDFVAGTNADDAGIEDFPDSGGSITLLDARENSKIIVHKEDGILIFRLDYTATAKVPYLETITLAEDSGASYLKAGAGLNQTTYFVAGQEGLKSIQRAIEGADLNLDSESDIILPTLRNYDFSTAAAVYYPYKRAIYVACKKSSSSNYNDKIITYYIRKTLGGGRVIDISIDDGFVNDWAVDGKSLYAFSSVDQNCYLMFDTYSDRGVGIEHKWVSKEFTYGDPARTKEFDKVYIDGFIRHSTKIKISVLYGILGQDDQKDFILTWDNTDYVSAQKISALGSDVLGTVSVGASSVEIEDSYVFSVPVHVDVSRSSRYKIKIATYYDEKTLAESYWAVSSIGTNPRLGEIEYNKVQNTNI